MTVKSVVGVRDSHGLLRVLGIDLHMPTTPAQVARNKSGERACSKGLHHRSVRATCTGFCSVTQTWTLPPSGWESNFDYL
jgi:hypothetical protein